MAPCPECGSEQDTGRFCGRCGAALATGSIASGGPDGDDGSERATSSTPSSWSWAAVTVVALAVGTAVALQGSSANRVAPDEDPARPTSASASPQSGPPPRPTTVPGNCPDALVGCVLWRTDLTGATSITAAVPGRDPRHAYLGAVLADGGGALYAIDPTNGIQLWRRRLPGPPRAPIVTPWGAVVVAYDDPRVGSGLRSYHPDTGELGWQADGALAGRTTAGPVVAGRTVASAGPRQLMLHHLDTGTVTLVEIDGTPAAMLGGGDGEAATFLVLMDSGGVRAYAPDGSTRWTSPASTMGTAMPDGRTVLVEPLDQVVGISGTQGEVWRRTIDLLALPPVVAGSEAVLIDPHGSLIRVALEDGSDLGRIDLDEGLVSGPFTIDRGTAFLPACGGVTAIALATGAEVFTTGLSSSESCAALPSAVPGEAGPLLVGSGTRLHGVIRASSVP